MAKLLAEFSLTGEMPSKKNAWKRAKDGRVFIPADMKKEIDGFLWQIKSQRDAGEKPIIGDVVILTDFFMKNPAQRDGDNMHTTVLDMLQSAGIIENDKQVRVGRYNKQKCSPGMASTEIQIYEFEKQKK